MLIYTASLLSHTSFLGQKSSHCCCALLRSATGQRLGNSKLH